MRLLAQSRLRSARLVLAGVAFLTLAGGTAAVAAPLPGGAPAATFTWHTFKLLNGWKSASKKLLMTGTPAWADHNGVVYLRGTIRQPVLDGSVTFARLPKYARPARKLYNQVFTASDVPGVVFIGSGGILQAYDGNAEAVTSLGGISYPTTVIKTHQLALRNGWTSSQPIFQTGSPSYAICNGVVYLSGSMHSAGGSPLAFILPKAARPSHALFISVYTLAGTSPGVLEIEPQGEVDVSGGNATGYTSLASISFPVAGTKWHNFKLTGGWKTGVSKFDTATPAYAVINGVVYLNGSLYQPAGGAGLWTTIPAAARPADEVFTMINTTSSTAGVLDLAKNLGIINSAPFSNAQMFTSLAAVAYPSSS
jgi:hypothetical protein